MKDQIDINDIVTLKNIRTEIGDVSELMASIRENGLLQPIGVFKSNEEYVLVYGNRRFSALKKLGRKSLEIGKEIILVEKGSDMDLIILNIIENYHRQPNTPLEFGKACLNLRELGLSISEIAVRLSATKHKIVTAISLIKNIPERHKKYISYIQGSSDKKGKLSATVSSALAYHKKRYQIKDEDIDTLLEEARINEFTAKDVRVIGLLLQEGMPLKKAMKEKDLYINKQVDFIVKREELELLKEPFRIYAKKILVRQNSELFYESDKKSEQ